MVEGEEVTLERGDGTFGTFVLSSSPILDEQGRISSAVMTFSDISEPRRQELEAHKRADFEKQLIGIVSHDLRAPLTTIIMSAATSLRRGGLDELQAKSISRIVSSAGRAERMIADLLDLTRIRLGGGIKLDRKRADLHQLTGQVVEEMQLAYPQHTFSLHQSGDGVGDVDVDRLTQVLTNLLNNARQFGPPDLPIEVHTEGEDDWLILTVANRGAPIPLEQISRIFEPMARGVRETRTGSVGLGLFIVKEIIVAHGGKIEVSSDAEQGTRFRIRIPRRAHDETT